MAAPVIFEYDPATGQTLASAIPEARPGGELCNVMLNCPVFFGYFVFDDLLIKKGFFSMAM